MKNILKFLILFSFLLGNISFVDGQQRNTLDLVNSQKAQEISNLKPLEAFRLKFPKVEEYTGRPLTEDESRKVSVYVVDSDKLAKAKKAVDDFEAGKITEEQLYFILKAAGLSVLGGTGFAIGVKLLDLVEKGIIKSPALITFLKSTEFSSALRATKEITIKPLTEKVVDKVIKRSALLSFGGIVGRFLKFGGIFVAPAVTSYEIQTLLIDPAIQKSRRIDFERGMKLAEEQKSQTKLLEKAKKQALKRLQKEQGREPGTGLDLDQPKAFETYFQYIEEEKVKLGL